MRGLGNGATGCWLLGNLLTVLWQSREVGRHAIEQNVPETLVGDVAELPRIILVAALLALAQLCNGHEDEYERRTDPQKELLTPESVIWDEIGETVEENAVVEKLARLREAACDGQVPVFYSAQWFGDDEYGCTLPSNTIGELMDERRMFDETGPGSEFPPALEPDDNTFVCSPHKGLSGFWSNDIDTQLQQRGIETIVLAGMGANLCVESHLRDAVENGYEVLVVTDATAAPGRDALDAALTNFEFIAHETATTAAVAPRLETADE